MHAMTGEKRELWREVAGSYFGFAEAAENGNTNVRGFNQAPFYRGPQGAVQDLIPRLEAFATEYLEGKPPSHKAALESALSGLRPNIQKILSFIERPERVKPSLRSMHFSWR
jgi:hypothetical protein